MAKSKRVRIVADDQNGDCRVYVIDDEGVATRLENVVSACVELAVDDVPTATIEIVGVEVDVVAKVGCGYRAGVEVDGG